MDRPPPFLSKNDPSPENEDEWPSQPPPQQHFIPRTSQPDIFDQLKSNPMALVLIGIIIGAILVNMRPVVIAASKST